VQTWKESPARPLPARGRAGVRPPRGPARWSTLTSRAKQTPSGRTGPNPRQTNHIGYGDDRSPTAQQGEQSPPFEAGAGVAPSPDPAPAAPWRGVMPATPPCSGRPAPGPQRQAPAGHPPSLHERSPVPARPVGFQPRPRLRHAWRPARPGPQRPGRPDQRGQAQEPQRPAPAPRLHPDRAGDRVGGDPARGRRPAARAQLGP
jgi:hypothetical protein